MGVAKVKEEAAEQNRRLLTKCILHITLYRETLYQDSSYKSRRVGCYDPSEFKSKQQNLPNL
jgi:hypothetical protein